jgi:plastocyanin
MRVHLLIAAVLVSACGGSDSTTKPSGPASTSKTVDVFTVGDTFSPTFSTISVGDTVRWTFSGGSDGQGHNVRFSPRTSTAPADINILLTGSATRVFTAAGTYSYVCDVHPGMNAQIIVQ